MSGGNGETDVGGGGDIKPTAPAQTGTTYVTGEHDAFQSSNLNADSALAEGWRKLAFQMQPSQGAGSGKIDPESVSNDAQWLRQFSIVVYKSGLAESQAAAGDPEVAHSPAAQAAAYRRRAAQVLQFPRRGFLPPALRDTPSTTLDDVNVTAPAPAQKTQTQERGLDLSNLRCTFNINKTTMNTPNILYARIYNLAPATLAKVIEFTRVQIHAGYRYANYGLIFDGKVVQYRRGKENPVDTYLEIHAGDGDAPLNEAVIHDSSPAGTKIRNILDKFNAAKKELDADFKVGAVPNDLYNETTKRTRVHFATVKNLERELMIAYNAEHFADNGQYIMQSKGKYRDDEAVILSPKTGLIGMPEVTPQGIQAKCLLNPRIKLGGLVKIKSDILSGVAYTPGTASKTDADGNVIPGDPTGGIKYDQAMYGQQLETAYTSPIGLYKVILLNYNGDTRGNPWYCDMICVALNSQNVVVNGANPSSAWSRAAPEAKSGTAGSGATG
jgi:hypothetical protein